MRGQVQEMQMAVGANAHYARVDFVTRSDLDKKITELHSHLCELKDEKTKEQLSEMKDQLQEIQRQLLERSEASEPLADGGLGTVMGRTVEQVLELTGQMQEVQAMLSERSACEDLGHCKDLDNIKDATMALSEIRKLLTKRNELDCVTRADLDTAQEYVLGRVSYLENDLDDLHRLSDDLDEYPDVSHDSPCRVIPTAIRFEANDVPSCSPCGGQWFHLSREESVISL